MLVTSSSETRIMDSVTQDWRKVMVIAFLPSHRLCFSLYKS